MAFIKTRMLIDRPLALHRLAAPDIQVLESVAQGKALTVANLDLWVARSSGEQRGLLTRIQKSLFEPGLVGSDKVVVNGQAVDVSRSTGQMLSSRRAVDGVPAEITELRARLPNALWGQEHALQAFEIARQDGLSTTRRTSSLLLLKGDIAQGKDQALEGFAALLGKPAAKKPEDVVPAQVIEVNLAAATDRDAGALFGEEGPLGTQALTAAAKKGNVLVRLRNPPTGQNVLAAQLNALFSDESPRAKALHFVADYDGRGSADAAFGASFGAQGLRHVSADVEFEHLTPQVMLRYANRAMTELLTGSRLEGQTPVFDESAREALANLLATKHEPLDELKPRLQQLVLSHVHTQTSFDPKNSILKFELTPTFDDPTLLAARIDELHQPKARLANDAFAPVGKRLFQVSEVARKADLSEAELGLLMSEIVDHTTAVGRLLEGNDEAVGKLRSSIEAMVKESESASAYGWRDRVSEAQYERYESLVTEIEGALLELAEQPLDDAAKFQLREIGTALSQLHTSVARLARKEDDAAEGLSGATLLSRLEPAAK